MDDRYKEEDRIKKTFVFDRNINPNDYGKYIKKEDIVDS